MSIKPAITNYFLAIWGQRKLFLQINFPKFSVLKFLNDCVVTHSPSFHVQKHYAVKKDIRF